MHQYDRGRPAKVVRPVKAPKNRRRLEDCQVGDVVIVDGETFVLTMFIGPAPYSVYGRVFRDEQTHGEPVRLRDPFKMVRPVR